MGVLRAKKLLGGGSDKVLVRIRAEVRRDQELSKIARPQDIPPPVVDPVTPEASEHTLAFEIRAWERFDIYRQQVAMTAEGRLENALQDVQAVAALLKDPTAKLMELGKSGPVPMTSATRADLLVKASLASSDMERRAVQTLKDRRQVIPRSYVEDFRDDLEAALIEHVPEQREAILAAVEAKQITRHEKRRAG